MKRFKNLTAILLAFVMVFLVGFSFDKKSYAKEELKIAQYITNKKLEMKEENGKVFYKGIFEGKIPLAKVIESYSNLMVMAKDKNGYPHGKDGKNQIAYIDYNLKFPNGIKVDKITTVSKSNMIPQSTITKELNNNNINFKFRLTDQNWKGVYEAFLEDMKDVSKHTVDVTVEYSFEGTKADFEKIKYEKIKGQGDFSFYPYGWAAASKMEVFLQVYKIDSLNINICEN